MNERLEHASSILLTVAAIAIAAAVVRREFLPPPTQSAPPVVATRPEFIREWKDIARAGVADDGTQRAVTIIEFGDFECPFCRSVHGILRSVAARHRATVSTVFVHFPISSHRFARPAARAAECAGLQHRFYEFADKLYAKQDSLGLRSWSSYARDAGVRNVASFDQCTAATAPIERIEAGVAAGERIKLTGTPTVIINGWRLPKAPSEVQLDTIVTELAAGRQPFAKGAGK